MKYLSFLLISLISLSASAQRFELDDNWPFFNGPINAIVEDTANQILYVGGDFSKVEPSISFGASLDTLNGLPLFTEYHPNGSVLTAIPDSSGGWYIGGHFTKVGPFERDHIAHIDRFGIPTSRFNKKGFDDAVRCLALRGDTLYAGGSFRTYGDVKRRSGLIDLNSGLVDINFPETDDRALSAVGDGNGGWFIGGHFTRVGNTLRGNLAHVDSTGLVTPWKLSVNGGIYCMEIKDSILYLGGDFTKVDGQKRERLAAYDLSNQTLLSWQPTVDRVVQSMQVSDSLVYIGGPFDDVNGIRQPHFAIINLIDDSLNAFRPNVSGYTVNTIKLRDSMVYIGGDFLSCDGNPRRSLAAYNINTNTLANWSPNAKRSNISGYIIDIEVYNNSVFIAGDFDSIAGVHRPNVAEVNHITGQPTSWKPQPSNTVYAIEIENDHLYIGGDYNEIANQERYSLSAVDLANGKTLSPWNPSVEGNILDMATANGKIFLGGSVLIGGSKRKGLVAIDINTSDETSWAPQVNGRVEAITFAHGNIYVGGAYDKVGNTTRNNLSAINLTTGNPTSWNPNANGQVLDLLIDWPRLYVAGNYTTMSGFSRENLVSFSLNSHTLTLWFPQVAGSVSCMKLKGDTMFIGGNFNSIQNQSRNRIAALHKTTQQLYSWNPNVNGTISAIEIIDDAIYFAGNFNQVNGSERNHIASYSLNTNSLRNWNPDAEEWILSLTAFNDQIYVGGQFRSIGRRTKNNIAAISTVSRKLTNWNPQISGEVYALALSDSLLYVGGKFFNVNGAQNRGLVALTLDSGSTFSWTPALDLSFGLPTVKVLKIYNSKLFIGGVYNTIHGQTRASLSSVDLNTHTLTSFDPNIIYGVNALERRGNDLFVGGDFQSIDGLPIKYIGIVNINTGTPRIWNRYSSLLNRGVDALGVFGTTLYVGGRFDRFSRHLISIDLTPSNPTITNWRPDIFDDVTSMIVTDSCVFVGGIYNKYINRISGEPNNFSYSSRHGLTNTMLFTDSTLFLGGDYSGFSYPRNNFSAFKVIQYPSSIEVITACDSLQWIDGNVYRESSFANFIFTDQFGFDSIVNLDLTINRIDTGIIRTNNTLECVQDSARYQWLDCNNNFTALVGDTNKTFTAIQNGLYACAISYKNCTDTTSCFAIVSTSLSEISSSDLKVYPNPTSDLLNIELANYDMDAEISILNSAGQRMFEDTRWAKSKISINTSSWVRGVYTLIYRNDNEVITRKIIHD